MSPFHARLCQFTAVVIAAGTFPTAAPAAPIRVTITGQVESNGFTSGTFAGIPGGANGAPVTLVIDLNSENFLDSAAFPNRVRGYRFGPANLRFTVGPVTVPMRSDITTAYFCIRNNDPRADGFFISRGTDIPVELPLVMTPNNFGVAFSRTFGAIPPPPSSAPDATLTSVNLLDALGFWGFENISSYNFTVQRGDNQTPMIITYQTIRIQRAACNPADITGIGGPPAQPDSLLTGDDFNAFIAGFAAGQPIADVTGIGGPPALPDGLVTGDDFVAFVSAFATGCP